MLLKDISLSTPEENIVYDEALHYLAEKEGAGEVMRFWESPEMFVVLGRIGNEKEDVDLDAAARDGIPVLRRASGGGTVLQGKGCLNYTLVLSKQNNRALNDLHKSYAYILDKVITALKNLNVDAEFFPISDIALAGTQKKISGNAQKRSRQFILHHGTILYDFDLAKIATYLRMPKDIPEYRHGRSHLDFVCNVPVVVADLKRELKKTFQADREQAELTDQETAHLQRLLKAREVRLNIL